jgi:hypothetical protein
MPSRIYVGGEHMYDVQEMNPQYYRTAGCLAIIAAILMFPLGILAFLGSPISPIGRFFQFTYTFLQIVQSLCIIYPLWCFRGLLHDNFQFHNVDGLITGLIIVNAAMAGVELVARIIFTLFIREVSGFPQVLFSPPSLVYLSASILVASAASIVWIVFAVRLLRLQDDLRGMLRPFAITSIVAHALCLTIILGLFGVLLLPVCFIMLGMIFFRMANPPAQVDFV